MNFKAIINLFSILVLLFSLSYVFPIVVSLVFDDNSLQLFLPAFIFIGVLGLIGFYFTKRVKRDLTAKDGFVIIVMFWLVLSLAGSIPFYLSGMSPIDSFFESMSGITTTGATVISNINFFGRDAYSTTLVQSLAVKTKAAVLYLYINSSPKNFLSISIECCNSDIYNDSDINNDDNDDDDDDDDDDCKYRAYLANSSPSQH